jgi:hypothetical protein
MILAAGWMRGKCFRIVAPSFVTKISNYFPSKKKKKGSIKKEKKERKKKKRRKE